MFKFPGGDAGASRVLGVAKALRESGHDVVFLGIENFYPHAGDLKISGADFVSVYNDFRVVSPAPTGLDFWGRLKRQFSISTGSSFLDRLNVVEINGHPLDAVIAYQAPPFLLLRLKRWCRLRHIPLICDVVEWYDPKQLFLGRTGPFYWGSELRMRCIQKKVDGIIAISKYLMDYYSAHKKKVIRIPILVDAHNIDSSRKRLCSCTNDKGLHMVYAGIPGRKDLLGNVLRGVLRLRHKGYTVTIKLVGVSRENVLQCLNGDENAFTSLGDGLILYPRIPRSEVHRILAEADFVPLLRPDERYAHAGFPTKVVESLAAGIPVIANLTSDLGEYLHEGINAFIVHGSTVDAFVDAVERAMRNWEKWDNMRNAAKKTATNYFDYKVYASNLNIFLEEVVGGVFRK